MTPIMSLKSQTTPPAPSKKKVQFIPLTTLTDSISQRLPPSLKPIPRSRINTNASYSKPVTLEEVGKTGEEPASQPDGPALLTLALPTVGGNSTRPRPTRPNRLQESACFAFLKSAKQDVSLCKWLIQHMPT